MDCQMLRTLAEKKESFGIAINNLYLRSTERLVGVYLFFRPAILIRDPHLAKRIMLNDFQYFHDRGVYCNEERDPLSSNLFALPDQRWKNLRARLTPTFTSGQLRNMMPTFLDVVSCSAIWRTWLGREKIVDMRDISARYVLDVVASVFFGFEANCIRNPDDPFRDALRDLNNPDSFVNNIRNAAVFICPGLLKLTGLNSLPPTMHKLATDVVAYHLNQREQTQTSRKDFIQLLIDLRSEAESKGEEPMSIEQCAANVFLFYAAGVDTSTGVISYTLHEFTHNPEVMAKARQEIDETLERHGGKITYENMMELKYLDLCIKETLRKYPGLPILNRECTQDYQVPESDVVIRKGMQMVIPLLAISMNEKYFPDPDLYSPERFNEGTINHDPDAYYPFGVGPRNCIGLRQGILLSKIALALMLSKFNFHATNPQKVLFEAVSISLAPKDGLPMKIERREDIMK
ncbi:AGAP008219-PA-like protein [Anopheles sinensis]|uniref:AGAP008219-PA-like protein n=1 Tax=Anopheles sinensis TaxID=74873 RepID=A0A084W4I2_ANOSI|nr:AGAP008219-PA-like protein [Anopheles sinensis]